MVKTIVMPAVISMGFFAMSVVYASDIPATCKGTQTGQNNKPIDVKYAFTTDSSGIVAGAAQYTNVWANSSATGKLSNISASGDKISFDVMYDGGLAHGTVASYVLHKVSGGFKGTGKNSTTKSEFVVVLECK